MCIARWFWSVMTAFTIALVPMAFGQDAKSTIRLHTPGPSVLSLAFEIAKEEGFYRQESVQVDLITMASGSGVQGLIGGMSMPANSWADFARGNQSWRSVKNCNGF